MAVVSNRILVFSTAIWAGVGIDCLVPFSWHILCGEIKCRIIDTKVHYLTCERRSKKCCVGIVSVKNQRCAAWQQAYCLLPAGQYAVNFAITVKLVAEKVGKDGAARRDCVHDLWHHCFIDLNYCEILPCPGQYSTGPAAYDQASRNVP